MVSVFFGRFTSLADIFFGRGSSESPHHPCRHLSSYRPFGALFGLCCYLAGAYATCLSCCRPFGVPLALSKPASRRRLLYVGRGSHRLPIMLSSLRDYVCTVEACVSQAFVLCRQGFTPPAYHAVAPSGLWFVPALQMLILTSSALQMRKNGGLPDVACRGVCPKLR